MKIGILTGWNKTYQPLADIAMPVLRDYAVRHGYDIITGEYHMRDDRLHDRGDRLKLRMFGEEHAKYDILMWLDIDAIVMNHRVPIERRLYTHNFDGPGRPLDFCWTYDINGPCSGFWIARCTPMMRQFFSRVQYCAVRELATDRDPFGRSDQTAMIQVMQFPPYTPISELCVSGKSAGHCYLYETLGWPEDLKQINHYTPGDWIITFPSLPLERRIELMRHYAAIAKETNPWPPENNPS